MAWNAPSSASGALRQRAPARGERVDERLESGRTRRPTPPRSGRCDENPTCTRRGSRNGRGSAASRGILSGPSAAEGPTAAGRRSSCLKKRCAGPLEPVLELAAHGVGHRAEAAPRRSAPCAPRRPRSATAPRRRRARRSCWPPAPRASCAARIAAGDICAVGLLVAGEALDDLAELLHPLPGRLRIQFGALESGRPARR